MTASLREAAQLLIDAHCAMLNAFVLDTKRPETIAQANAAFRAREAIHAGRAALALPDEPLARQPLTEKQKRDIWASSNTQHMTAMQLFLEGFDAAEQAHNIKGAA